MQALRPHVAANDAAVDLKLDLDRLSVPKVRSEDLLQGKREIVIEHHGLQYRLLLTRNDRLILNK